MTHQAGMSAAILAGATCFQRFNGSPGSVVYIAHRNPPYSSLTQELGASLIETLNFVLKRPLGAANVCLELYMGSRLQGVCKKSFSWSFSGRHRIQVHAGTKMRSHDQILFSLMEVITNRTCERWIYWSVVSTIYSSNSI